MIDAAVAFLKALSWQTYAVVALVVAAGCVYVEKTAHIRLLEHELAGMTKERDDLRTERQAAVDLGKKTAAANKAIEAQRIADQKEASNEAQRMSIRARDDSSAAGAALASLLKRAAAPAGDRHAARDPAAAGVGAPAEGAGLRTDLLGSVGDEAVRYARIADVARIGRAECEAKYDALTAAQPAR